MQLSKHISYLLYRYDCVTVPGLGAFLGTPSPAQLDIESETIYPPTKTISFNAQLQSNDGLLANAIAVEQQTTYEQAVRLVHKEVVRWKSMLHDGKTIELDRIGKLHFNTDGIDQETIWRSWFSKKSCWKIVQRHWRCD